MNKNKYCIMLIGSLAMALGVVGTAVIASYGSATSEINAATGTFNADYNANSSDITITNGSASGTSIIAPTDRSNYAVIKFKDLLNGRKPTDKMYFTIKNHIYTSASSTIGYMYFGFYSDADCTNKATNMTGSGSSYSSNSYADVNTILTISTTYSSYFENDVYLRIGGGSTSYPSIIISSINVTFPYEETTPVVSKTLTSVAVSGSPTKTSYENGDALNTAGLIVTGTYDDESQETISDGIAWEVDPATLSTGATSAQVRATVDGIASPWYTVNGLTVAEKEITADDNYALNQKDTFATQSASKVTWEGGHSHLSLTKGSSTKDANYSIPATGNYNSATMIVGGQNLNFSPYGDNKIKQATITPFYSSNYLANGTLTNCTLEYKSSTTSYILTPLDGTKLFTITPSGGAYDQTNLKTVVITYSEGEASTFESNYVRKTPYTNTTNTGACAGAEGYYAKAKAAFAGLSETAKNSFLTNADYDNARARLTAWAIANGETFDLSTGAFSAAQINGILNLGEESAMSIALVATASVIGVAGAITLFARRKRA